MRKVARPHDRLCPDRFLDVGDHPLVTLAANETLIAEDFAWEAMQRWIELARHHFGVLVEALQPERCPTTGGLHKPDTESRVPVEQARLEQGTIRQHRLEWMGGRMAEEEP